MTECHSSKKWICTVQLRGYKDLWPIRNVINVKLTINVSYGHCVNNYQGRALSCPLTQSTQCELHVGGSTGGSSACCGENDIINSFKVLCWLHLHIGDFHVLYQRRICHPAPPL